MAGGELVVGAVGAQARPRADSGAMADHGDDGGVQPAGGALGNPGDVGVVPFKKLMPVRAGRHPPVEVTGRPGKDRGHVPLVGFMVRELLQGAGLDFVESVQHFNLEALQPGQRRSSDLGPHQRGCVQCADLFVGQGPRHRLRLPLAQFGEPGPRVGGVQLAEYVAGGLSVADEEELHGSSFAPAGQRVAATGKRRRRAPGSPAPPSYFFAAETRPTSGGPPAGPRCPCTCRA